MIMLCFITTSQFIFILWQDTNFLLYQWRHNIIILYEVKISKMPKFHYFFCYRCRETIQGACKLSETRWWWFFGQLLILGECLHKAGKKYWHIRRRIVALYRGMFESSNETSFVPKCSFLDRRISISLGIPLRCMKNMVLRWMACLRGLRVSSVVRKFCIYCYRW